MKKLKRNRILYGCVLFLVILFGLYSRSPYPLPELLKLYAGDILWASALYFFIAICFCKLRIRYVVLMTLVISCLIECSQLLMFDWLVYLRSTIWRLLLGQGFLWSDLICYGIGCMIACGIDGYLCHRKYEHSS